MGGGLWGILITPILMEDGIVYGGGYKGIRHAGIQLAVNVIGAVAIIAWTVICAFVVFGGQKFFKKLRVPREVEINGKNWANFPHSSRP